MTKDKQISLRMDTQLHNALGEAHERYKQQIHIPISLNLFIEICVLQGLQSMGASDLLRAAGVPGAHNNQEDNQ